jgi:outer membrane biosynthesis protein TonB
MYRSCYYTYNLKQRLISSMWLLCRKRKWKKMQWFPVHEDVEEMEMQVPQQDLQVVVHEPMEEVHVVQEMVDETTEKVQGEEQVVKVQTTPKKSVKHAIRKKLTPKKSCDNMSLYGPVTSL